MITKDTKNKVIKNWLKRERRKHRKDLKLDLPAIVIAPSKKVVFNQAFITTLNYPKYIFYIVTPEYDLMIGKSDTYNKNVNYAVSYVNKRRSGAVATFPAYLFRLLADKIEFRKKIYAKSIINPSNKGVRIVFSL